MIFEADVNLDHVLTGGSYQMALLSFETEALAVKTLLTTREETRLWKNDLFSKEMSGGASDLLANEP